MRDTKISKLEVHLNELRVNRISMDTVQYLESIVHFYSYARYILLHMGRRSRTYMIVT
jgi:hypothetical protein